MSTQARSRALLCAALVAGCALGWGQTIDVTVTPNVQVLTAGADPAGFSSPPNAPSVLALTAAPSRPWTLSAVATPTNGSPAIPGNALVLIPVANSGGPFVQFATAPVNLGAPALIAHINPGAGPQIGAFTLVATLPDRYTPPGTYTGTINFTAMTGFGQARTVCSLQYTYNVQAWTVVNFDEVGMQFHSSQPGTYLPTRLSSLTVETNQTSGQAVATLGQMASGQDHIPATRTCIAYATGAAGQGAANANAMSTPLGQNSFTINLNRGLSTFWVSGRVQTDIGDKPGDYHGLITVQLQ